MRKILGAFSAALFAAFAFAQAAEEPEETPAEPLHRIIPDYPTKCYPKAGEPAEDATVTVTFSVMRDGETENIRVRETTNECFSEAAINAVRQWTYEPRRVGGRRVQQDDLETTFQFEFNEQTEAQDFDARPITRVPPRYPDRCQYRADDSESVLLEFDVAADGTTQNVRVIKSTNSCFNRAAIESVEKWLYYPKVLDGEPVVRKGVRNEIVFELHDGSPVEFRLSLAQRLDAVWRIIRRGDDPAEALAMLEEIEQEYGDDFSQEELLAFLQTRGTVRAALGDYAGALDDLRFVQRSGMAGEAVAELIRRLEVTVATQQREGADAEPSDESDD